MGAADDIISGLVGLRCEARGSVKQMCGNGSDLVGLERVVGGAAVPAHALILH